MTSKNHHRDEAYQLGTPADHREYYDNWARSYEDDFVAASGYAYHQRIAALFNHLHPHLDGTIADIGCGTGVVGAALRQCGVTAAIDGIDISEGMLAVARDKNIYRNLYCADLTRPESLPEIRCQAMISTGTFTHGHLGPDALENLFQMAAAGCAGVIGINAAHFEDMAFAEAFDTWQNTGLISGLDWHFLEIYADVDQAQTDSLMARVAAFTINHGEIS